MFFHHLRENILLIMTWVFAVFISTVSYIGMQNVIPSGVDIFLAHTLYAPIAIPNSFFHIVGIYIDNSAHRDMFFFVFALPFWAALGAAHYWYFAEPDEKGKCTLVIMILVLISSVKWLYFAEAIMHS